MTQDEKKNAREAKKSCRSLASEFVLRTPWLERPPRELCTSKWSHVVIRIASFLAVWAVMLGATSDSAFFFDLIVSIVVVHDGEPTECRRHGYFRSRCNLSHKCVDSTDASSSPSLSLPKLLAGEVSSNTALTSR